HHSPAALPDKVITNRPKMVKPLAEPLSKVDKISIISTGGANGTNGLGASRLTGDLVTMLAQVPALLEVLTGTKFSDLMARVPGLTTVDGSATAGGATNGNGSASSQPKEAAGAMSASGVASSNATHDA